MGLETVAVAGGGGGLGAYDYRRFVKSGLMSNINTTYQTLLSVTGKGILSKAILWAGGTTGHIMKITIDGTVVYWGQSSSADFQGIFSGRDIFYNGTSIYINVGNQYPTISANYYFNQIPFPTSTLTNLNQPVMIPPIPIKFNSTLLIELSSSASTYGAYHEIDYSLL